MQSARLRGGRVEHLGGGGVQGHIPLKSLKFGPSKCLEITFSALRRPKKSLFLDVKTLTDLMKDRQNHFSSM